MANNTTILIFIIFAVQLVFGFAGEYDEVKILPGLRKQPDFKHYSGYLNGSDSVMLHYWFVESQSNASKDPLVLWLNGGPGCSSLDGLLTEHGPFRVTEDSYLTYNPNSWNKLANMLYLESPACVGFSYSTTNNCSASDDSTSLYNFNALRHFLIKFPQFKNREFYVTGESYGGYYVPTLSVRIATTTPKLPVQFKGIAVGNGLAGWNVNNNGNLYFAYHHGLISDSLWSDIIKICCAKQDPDHCDIIGQSNLHSECSTKVSEAQSSQGNVNVYNIYAQCYNQPSSDEYIFQMMGVQSNWQKNNILFNPSKSKQRKLYKDIKMTGIKNGVYEPSLSIPCTNTGPSHNYLNNPLVRYALHIPTHVPEWFVCNSYVNVHYHQNYVDMSSQYRVLFNLTDFRIWIYNGDVDMACSYTSDEFFFEGLNRKLIKKRRPWMYNANMANPALKSIDNQIGGYVKVWDKFSLITVRGAGHMVPTDRPLPAYQMFDSFLRNQQL